MLLQIYVLFPTVNVNHHYDTTNSQQRGIDGGKCDSYVQSIMQTVYGGHFAQGEMS